VDPVSAAPLAPPDRLVRTLSRSGGIAVRALVATRLVAEAAERHGTSPPASVALGRALMGAVLLASSTKRETVQIELRGDGPLGSVVAIADPQARTRGYVSRPFAEAPPLDGRIDVAAAVGRHGTLSVVRHADDAGQPYTGIVPIVSGTVAQDLAHYLSESEQIRSAVALGVFLAEDGGIAAAGGYLVQALPGADEAEIALAEDHVRALPGPGERVREGFDADAIADELLGALGCRERHASSPRFHCGCQRERVLRAVALLGREDLERAAQDGETLEVRCRFCAKRYDVPPSDLVQLVLAS
jgi:molecular chaperone Hsp33